MTANNAGSVPSASGFKGWLLVLATFQALFLLRELLLLLQIGRVFVSGLPMVGIRPYSVLYGGRLAINAAFVVILVWAIILMARRSAAFIGWARFEMKLLIALPIAELAWLIVAPWSGRLLGSFAPIIGLILLHAAIGIAWLRYIEKSQRVAATFGR